MRARAGVAMRCTSSGSAICVPTRRTGFSACWAPWKTTEADAHRTARSRPHVIASTSSPSSMISPVTRAVFGSSRSRASASVDFPDPDSPATPRASPSASSSETPRTAGTSPAALR
nr:hypothetical protein GCM10020093_102900 [Planobispora longispora]